MVRALLRRLAVPSPWRSARSPEDIQVVLSSACHAAVAAFVFIGLRIHYPSSVEGLPRSRKHAGAKMLILYGLVRGTSVALRYL